MLRSSLAARAILARRLATPEQAVTQAMEQLSQVYERAGYEAQLIRRCLENICNIATCQYIHELRYLAWSAF